MDTSKNRQGVKELYAALEYADTQTLALAHGIRSRHSIRSTESGSESDNSGIHDCQAEIRP